MTTPPADWSIPPMPLKLNIHQAFDPAGVEREELKQREAVDRFWARYGVEARSTAEARSAAASKIPEGTPPLPRSADDDGKTYIAVKSRAFDDRWIVLKRVLVADLHDETTAKAIAKELNEALGS